jgi:hypothetical protein
MRGGGRMLALLATLCVAACGNQAQAPANQPTPTPTQDIKALAQTYTKIADEYNKTADALSPRFKNDYGKDLTAYKKDVGEATQAEELFIAGLRGMQVPPSMQQDFRALLAAVSAEDSITTQESQATDWQGISYYENQLSNQRNVTAGAVDNMRLDLGLPRAPKIGVTASPST